MNSPCDNFSLPRLAIPTKYNGRQYRSRLEARWAAFFDILHWPFEYEPCEFSGWIPDFVLLGKTKVFVEVKPVTEFPQEVAAKIDRAQCPDEVLIVGMTIQESRHPMWEDRSDALGWLGEKGEHKGVHVWGEAVTAAWWGPHWAYWGFRSAEGDYIDRISGLNQYGPNGKEWPLPGVQWIFEGIDGSIFNDRSFKEYGDGDAQRKFGDPHAGAVVRRWQEAGNRVQWKAPR